MNPFSNFVVVQLPPTNLPAAYTGKMNLNLSIPKIVTQLNYEFSNFYTIKNKFIKSNVFIFKFLFNTGLQMTLWTSLNRKPTI